MISWGMLHLVKISTLARSEKGREYSQLIMTCHGKLGTDVTVKGGKDVMITWGRKIVQLSKIDPNLP